MLWVWGWLLNIIPYFMHTEKILLLLRRRQALPWYRKAWKWLRFPTPIWILLFNCEWNIVGRILVVFNVNTCLGIGCGHSKGTVAFPPIFAFLELILRFAFTAWVLYQNALFLIASARATHSKFVTGTIVDLSLNFRIWINSSRPLSVFNFPIDVRIIDLFPNVS